ncbi:MAG: T9SS type A sorting domain-containing protein [Bacteroidales bacterium]|nr:T9SS type A sorting domain-containing protein [Bacteroidales bacterium]
MKTTKSKTAKMHWLMTALLLTVTLFAAAQNPYPPYDFKQANADGDNNVESYKDANYPQWTYWSISPATNTCYPQTFSLYSDTVIQGVSYRLSDFSLNTISGQQENLLVCENNTGFYYFDPYTQTSRVLYDYSVSAGDQYVVYPILGDTNHLVQVVVDSVGAEWIGNQNLKTFYIHTVSINHQAPDYSWNFNFLDYTGQGYAKIIEHIGSTCFFLPQKSYEIQYDDIFYTSLCAFDDETFYYQPIDGVNCDEPGDCLTSGILQHDALSIEFYPNPTDGTVSVESTGGVLIEIIMVYDSFGRIVATYEINDLLGTFDMHSLHGGLYLLRAQMSDGTVQSGKVMKL